MAGYAVLPGKVFSVAIFYFFLAFSGFRATGIPPFNRNMFPEHMFLPSLTTDIPIPSPIPSESLNQNVPSNINVLGNNSGPSSITSDNPMPSPMSSESLDKNIPSKNNASENNPGPSSSQEKTEVQFLVNELSPKPQCIKRTTKRRNNKAAYQNILTESPYLRELRKKAASKKLIEIRKSKRKLVKRKIVEDDDHSADDMDVNLDGQISDEDDCACLYCNDLYSRSKSNEGWLNCQLCGMWSHAECAGLPKRAKQFIGELCTD